MFATLKQIFAPTNKDLRKRILFTLGGLLIFIIGTGVRVPGTTNITSNLGFLELINVMGGGSLKRFSIFALGVSPYITASIMIQLVQMLDIIPYFKELSNEGPVGRRKINQITRYLGIILAFIEGYAFSFAFLGSSNAFEYLYVAVILTAGTAFCLWLGDQITQKGIGNGISLMIMAGIIATLPTMFITAFNELVLSGSSIPLGITKFAVFVILYFLIIIGVVYVQESERRIPLQYANKTTGSYGSEQSFLPIKLNTAGVLPVIFASSLLAIPSTIANFVKNEGFTNFVSNYLDYSKPVGFIIYIALIFFFGYFWTFIQMKPEDVADNLKKNGGYIPGVRPGGETEEYISKSLGRVTIVGTILLIVLAALPILFSVITKLPGSISIGGTGLLIVVGVALETYKQLEGSLATRTYKKRRSRLR